MTTTTVSSGATSTSLAVNSGDFLLVSGTVITTSVNSGGTEVVQSAIDAASGGLASLTTVSGGGFEIVSAGGTAISTEVTSDGVQVVSNLGNTSFTTVDSAGIENVSSGGTTTATEVTSGGGEFVFAGGAALSTTVDAGGFLVVLPGGTQTGNAGVGSVVSGGVVLYSPASGTTSPGATPDPFAVSSGATDYVLSGGSTTSTSVGAGGTELVFSSGVATSAMVGSGGKQTISNGGIASFTTVSNGGAQFVLSGGTAISGSVNSGGAENVASSGTASFTTVSGGGFEVISAGGSATGTTVDLSGSIILMDLPGADGGTATVDSSTDMLTVSQGGGPVYTQQLSGTYTDTKSFNLLLGTGPYAGGAQVELEGTLCFCIDTLIETPSGQVKVQDLAVGDLVMTQRGEARPIVWIGTGAVLATRGRRSAATPVIVRKGALADNVPTPRPAGDQGPFALYRRRADPGGVPGQPPLDRMGRPGAGSEAVPYRAGNARRADRQRRAGGELSRRRQPLAVPQRQRRLGASRRRQPCAPVLTGGPLVDAVWRRLLDRAGPRPGLPLTEDADLHLLVDGRRLDAASRHGETQVFRLPARARDGARRLAAGAPQELGVARDPRVLGVALRRIMLRQGPRLRMIEAEDATLAEGFHGYEAEQAVALDGRRRAAARGSVRRRAGRLRAGAACRLQRALWRGPGSAGGGLSRRGNEARPGLRPGPRQGALPPWTPHQMRRPLESIHFGRGEGGALRDWPGRPDHTGGCRL